MGIVLGIESSCDETAAALVDSERRILAQRIASQDEAHRPYGGVVPEIAARAHAERIAPLVEATLADAGMALDDVDAIAATTTWIPRPSRAAAYRSVRAGERWALVTVISYSTEKSSRSRSIPSTTG